MESLVAAVRLVLRKQFSPVGNLNSCTLTFPPGSDLSTEPGVSVYYSWGSYFAIDEGQRWAASGSLRASITQLDLAKPRNPLGHKECPGGSKREGVGWKSIYLVWLSMFIDLKCILFFEALLSPVRVFIQSGIKFPPAHVFFFSCLPCNPGCRAQREGQTPRPAWRRCGLHHQPRHLWYSLSQPPSR